MALLLKAAASFWDVDHSLTRVVGFSHPYSTEFHTLTYRFQEDFHPYFSIDIVVPIKVRRDHKRVTVFHDNRGQGSTLRSKHLNTRANPL